MYYCKEHKSWGLCIAKTPDLKNPNLDTFECGCYKWEHLEWDDANKKCDVHKWSCETDKIKDVIGKDYCSATDISKHFKSCKVNDLNKGIECECVDGFKWNDENKTCDEHTWDCNTDKIKDVIGKDYCSETDKTKHFKNCKVIDGNKGIQCECVNGFDWIDTTKTCDEHKWDCNTDKIKEVIGKDYCSATDITKHFKSCKVNDVNKGIECECVDGYKWNDENKSCDKHTWDCNADKIKEVIGKDYCSAKDITKHFKSCKVIDGNKGIQCECVNGFDWIDTTKTCDEHKWDCNTDKIKEVIGKDYCSATDITKHFKECKVIDGNKGIQCECVNGFDWIDTTKTCDEHK
ncbi:matrilin-2-like isoform X4 [Oppia nitens]|uniref:matrilin-2-like isoform X4 n=1 Tax=Oppia nitens TaxID=1686743 RepID=UPI0023DA812F|nr:matrilin-2-like isoform X4 [Oppia nitens]